VTDTLADGPATATPGEPDRYHVRRVLDRREVESLLAEDRGYAAYALGHLEPDLFARSEFWHASGPDGGATLLHSSAMPGRTTFVAGAPAALDALLSLHPGPIAAYLSTCAPEHLTILERTYTLSRRLPMMRMTVNAHGFVPATAVTTGAPEVRRLRGLDVGTLNGLYASDGGPTGYHAADVERSVYYGAFEGRRLVAAAGTHIVSPHAGVAMVGNVMTHPAHRGQNLATRTTGAVTAELLERGCALVALTVEPGNAPAVRAYTRLGYDPGATVLEARIRRRDWTGLGSMARRWAGRRRGRGETYAYGRGLDEPADRTDHDARTGRAVDDHDR